MILGIPYHINQTGKQGTVTLMYTRANCFWHAISLDVSLYIALVVVSFKSSLYYLLCQAQAHRPRCHHNPSVVN